MAKNRILNSNEVPSKNEIDKAMNDIQRFQDLELNKVTLNQTFMTYDVQVGFVTYKLPISIIYYRIKIGFKWVCSHVTKFFPKKI